MITLSDGGSLICTKKSLSVAGSNKDSSGKVTGKQLHVHCKITAVLQPSIGEV